MAWNFGAQIVWSGQRLFHGLDGPGFKSWQGHKFFSFTNRPFRLWKPPSLLFDGSRVLLRDLRCWDIKLTTDFCIVLRLVWSYAFTLPIRLHDMGIVTRYGLHGLGIESQCGQWILCACQTCPLAHPSSSTMGTVFPYNRQSCQGRALMACCRLKFGSCVAWSEQCLFHWSWI